MSKKAQKFIYIENTYADEHENKIPGTLIIFE